MVLYNIIGDIHGRRGWEKLVDPNRINIFLGDYFDPYDSDYTFERCKDNFLNIITFTKTHPETILLLGNHDLHYIHLQDHSRLMFSNHLDILDLFLQNIHLFHGIAYAIGDDILISHAGFTKKWCSYSGYDGDKTLQSYTTHANNLFWDGYVEDGEKSTPRYWARFDKCGLIEFTFQKYMTQGDYFGTSPGHSPVWIRPTTLEYESINIDKDQVVGHTQTQHINIDNPIKFYNDDRIGKGKLILCDCLGFVNESLYIDYNGPGDYIYKINHKE